MNFLQLLLVILYLYMKTKVTCLDNCTYKITDKQMTDYLEDNLFED